MRLALVAALMAGVLAAERPEESWTNLNLLKGGQKVLVVRTNLKSVEGAFSACADEAISLRVKGDLVSVSRAEVFRVTLRERSKRLRNTLIGMAIGGGAAPAQESALPSPALRPFTSGNFRRLAAWRPKSACQANNCNIQLL